MKEGIHPNYQRTTIRCACGEVIETASTKKDITVEICSKCHPFYTGKQKLVDTSGRVDKFNKKYGGKTMASRILHLAAAKLILDEHPAADEKRFRLGSILPDAGERVSAHFRVRIDGGTKTMMALGGFRARFADKMDDPLYLGYYLHLVQDIVFRKVFYLDHGWKVNSPQKVERLYDDYRILNTWAIENSPCARILPRRRIFPPSRSALFPILRCRNLSPSCMRIFTTPPPPGECVHFTKAIAEEFLAAAVPLCRREIAALREGKTAVDERAWAWAARQEPNLSTPCEPS